MELVLYESYERDQILSLLGLDRSVCDGQWAFGGRKAACFTELGEAPRQSHFENAGRFVWVAAGPYKVNTDRHTPNIPPEVIASGAKNREMHLFVRPASPGKYIFVGRLEPAYSMSGGRGDFHGSADFAFNPALPSDVWSRLGGSVSSHDDPGAVDRALDRLHGPTTLDDRLEVLDAIVTYWHGPAKPGDGYSAAELEGWPLPQALRGWFLRHGRREQVMSGQNFLLLPERRKKSYHELRMVGDRLQFYVENQYCYQWSTLPDGDDPSVFGRAEDTDPWMPEGVTVSQHLILAAIFQLLMGHAPYGATTSAVDGNIFRQMEKRLRRLPFAWGWGSSAFYASRGIFMFAGPNGDDKFSVWIGAKTEHPLQEFKPFVDKTWDSVSF